MGKLKKRYNGESIYRCADSGKEIAVFGTIKCCHCGFHDDVRPGSGRRRFWCMSCNASTCGKPECDACVPWERAMEAAEAGIPVSQMPIKASVPTMPTFQVIVPEGCYAADSPPFCFSDGSENGIDVVPSSDPQRGDQVSRLEPEACADNSQSESAAPVCS